MNEDVTFDDIKEEVDESQDKEIDLPPTIADPEWPDYVMAHFEPEELDRGYPKVTGLRRMVNKLVGRLVYSCSQLESAASSDNAMTAVCSHKIQIVSMDTGDLLEFADTADAHAENITGNKAIKLHLTAVAATRAEARALRKALYLRIISAEELIKDDTNPVGGEQTNDTDLIKEHQKLLIKKKTKSLGVDLDKFIKHKDFSEKGFESIERVTYSAATSMIRALDKVQNNKITKEYYNEG